MYCTIIRSPTEKESENIVDKYIREFYKDLLTKEDVQISKVVIGIDEGEEVDKIWGYDTSKHLQTNIIEFTHRGKFTFIKSKFKLNERVSDCDWVFSLN